MIVYLLFFSQKYNQQLRSCPTPPTNQVWPGQTFVHASHHGHTFLERGLRVADTACGAPEIVPLYASRDPIPCNNRCYQTPETPGWACWSMDRTQGRPTVARSFNWFESMSRVHLRSDWNPSPRFSLPSLPPIKMQSGRGWSPPGQNQLPKSKIETGTNPTKSSELLYPCPCANLSNMFIGK